MLLANKVFVKTLTKVVRLILPSVIIQYSQVFMFNDVGIYASSNVLCLTKNIMGPLTQAIRDLISKGTTTFEIKYKLVKW